MISLLICLSLVLSTAGAGTSSIQGFVHDVNGNPADGVTVTTDDGHACTTDEEGWYRIPLEPGVYDIYTEITGSLRNGRNGVVVMEDEVTRVDLTLSNNWSSVTSASAAVESRHTRPDHLLVADGPQDLQMSVPGVLDNGLRNGSLKFLGGGVSNPNYELVGTLNASIPDNLHIRGGRRGEILYTMDGCGMTEPLSRAFIGTLPLTSIMEMKTHAGVYDARYGDFLSGIVEMETGTGGEEYTGEIRAEFNDWHAIGLDEAGTWGGHSETALYPWDSWRWSNVTPFNDARLELGGTVAGPEPVSNYLLPAAGLDVPGQFSMFLDGEFLRTGGGRDNRYGWGFDDWSETYRGFLKLSYKPGETTEIDLLTSFKERSAGWFGVGDYWSWSRYEDPYIFEGDTLSPEGDILYALPERTWSNSHIGARIDHSFSELTSITLGFSQKRAEYFHRIYNDPGSTDPMRQTEWLGQDWGPEDWEDYQAGITTDGEGFVREGTSRFPWMERQSTTNSVDLRTETIAWEQHDLSWGLQADFHDVFEYTVIVDGSDQVHQNTFDESPFSGGVYFQDRIEFQDGMVFSGGLRLDYFDPNYDRATDPLNIPSPPTLQNRVLNFIEAPPKYSLNPRLSFMMPITDRSSMRTAYGMYSQIPELRYLYHREDNSYTSDSVTVEDIPLGGNPDLDFQKSTMYELGFTYAVTDRITLDLAGYFREISNLVETDFFSYPVIGQYARFTSTGTADSRGLEASMAGRDLGFLSWKADYTLSRTTGSSSHPLQNYLYYLGGYQNNDGRQYLDWDQRHTLNLSLFMEVPRGRGLRIGGVPVTQGLGIGLEWEYGSGFPYTYYKQVEFVEPNTRRYPATNTANLKVVKELWLEHFSMDLWCEVSNLFNGHDIVDIQNIPWYHSWEMAGQNYDDDEERGDPTGPMNNPYAFGAPRFFRFGLGLNW